MATNPILAELSGLSPGAQQALVHAHTAMGGPGAAAAPAPTPSLKAPSATAPTPQIGGAQHASDLGAPSPLMATGQHGATSIGLTHAQDPGTPPALSAPPAGPPIRGTEQGDQLERTRLLSTGPGINQIHSKIENSSFGQNHPTLGKILGWGAEIPLHIAEAAGSMLGPTRTAEGLLPGTTAHHAMELRNLNSVIGKESEENLHGAQQGAEEARTGLTNEQTSLALGEAASKEGLEGAQTKHLGAQTEALENPKGEWKELAGYSGPNGGPLEINAATGETRPANVSGAKQNKPTKENTPQQQTYDDLIARGYTPIQAFEKIREKPGGTVINQGTWTLDEDQSGKPVLFNSKTGETRDAPPGLQKAGTHAKQDAASAPVQAALNYAHDYAARSVHTGPGDEALMEKFFELAKPSTGFRMSQPQIDMLRQAQSWMGSLEAHLRHATTGTWFSDTQRQQIAATMNDLGAAKGLGGGSGSGQGVNLKDAMALPINHGKSEADVIKDIEAHGHQVIR